MKARNWDHVHKQPERRDEVQEPAGVGNSPRSAAPTTPS